MTSNSTLMQQELELHKAENALLKQKLELLEQREREEHANFADAALHAEQNRQTVVAKQEADERRKFAELNIPRPENMKAYSALSYAVKSRLVEEFSADFPRELRAKEASGMDWATWDRLNHPERFAPEEEKKPWTWKDYTDANGTTLHYSEEHRRWLPGPTPMKSAGQ